MSIISGFGMLNSFSDADHTKFEEAVENGKFQISISHNNLF